MASRQRRFFLLLFILLVVCWLYNPFSLFFLNDDAIYIPKSLHLNYLYGASFRPISDISLLLDIEIFNTQAWGFHLTNLLLHLCCSVLVYFLAKKILLLFGGNNANSIAFLTSVLFLVYAFHSEAVLWVIGRGGSIAAIFSALAILFFIKAEHKTINYWYSLIFFTLGFYAYESVWIIPLIITILSLHCPWFLKSNARLKFFYVSGYWIAFFSFLLLRKLMVHSFVGTPYLNKSLITFDVKKYGYNYFALFLRSFVLPCKSTILFVSLSLFVLVTLLIVFILIAKKGLLTKFRQFIWMSFLVSLLPYIMFGIDTHDSESERFLYLPSVFLCIALADLFLLIPQKSVRNLIIALWIFYQLSSLYYTSESFKWSSTIAQKTIGEINGSKEKTGTIYLINTPTQYNGGFIFRIGIRDILNWLASDLKYNEIKTVSQREILEKHETFQAETVQLNGNEKKMFMQQRGINCSIQEGDAIFYWTDSSFLFIK